jgi:hypothetical protein
MGFDGEIFGWDCLLLRTLEKNQRIKGIKILEEMDNG